MYKQIQKMKATLSFVEELFQKGESVHGQPAEETILQLKNSILLMEEIYQENLEVFAIRSSLKGA